ncbi:uncharacterized protein LOC124419262 [Lucilia cuprina]|uniref:uncharacterized protein LOC124419262 n=1 Tax=Lucilia cuprina TaxID=7375 RepID=UPI001F06139E|nr:uncharacterized protein LOC124419262 [Lucilia cuprina]
MEKCAKICQEQNDIGNLVDDESDLLMDLLKKFDLVIVMKFLKEAYITYRSLQYIKNEDLKEIIPLVGLRLEFREKLFTWRKKEFGIDDETLSIPSKVQDWLYDSQQQSPSSLSSPLDKNLKDLLMETAKGKAILDFYQKGHTLTDLNRNELINIIIEDSLFGNRSLSPRDFSNLVEEICQVFPNEKNVQKYYFIPRRGKKNPSGKLYSKYVNMKSKRKKNDKLYF